MRPIYEIIIHCTATPEGRECPIGELRRWHRARGFADVGYHFVIHLDGTVSTGRSLAESGAHCAGHNNNSIGVAYVGGLAADGKTPKDTRTEAQRRALRKLVDDLKAKYPGAGVFPHSDFAAKACPCFDVHAEFD